MTYFKDISAIKYEGTASSNPLSYRYYDAGRQVLGKTMAEHLRLAVCYWHTFCWEGHDIFGAPTFPRAWNLEADPLKRAKNRADAAFEFISKLGLPYFTFHDVDAAPEGHNLQESSKNLHTVADYLAQKMAATGIKLLWGTANLFSHRRYMAGAATNPDPEVFAYAIGQVKAALDVTYALKGENYVFWGGREGYDSLLNTDLSKEAEQFAKFLSLIVDYKHKIGFKGTFLIEPKPCEPTKHQYDYDTATVFAFLQKYGLEKEFKVNIEANHATLAGHSFPHEVAYACANGVFGSIDANQGDAQLGWDTDQFPTHLSDLVQVMYSIISHGGFGSGGFNFDTKLRRQSIDLEDMFYGHICGVDHLARALLIVEDILAKDVFKTFKEQRYAKWQTKLGEEILAGKLSVEALADYALKHQLNPIPKSGHQELLEGKLNAYLK